MSQNSVAPATKSPPSTGAKIAGGIIAAVIFIGLVVCGINVFSSSSGPDDNASTRGLLVSKDCESALTKKAAPGSATFSGESYSHKKDPVWQLVGNIKVNGKPGVFTCALKRDGESFTVTAVDFVTN